MPPNRGKNTTLIASMTLSGMGEAMDFEGIKTLLRQAD